MRARAKEYLCWSFISPMTSSFLSQPIFFFHSGQPTNTMTVRIKYNKAVTLKHYPKLLRLLSAVCILILMSQKLGRTVYYYDGETIPYRDSGDSFYNLQYTSEHW